MQSSLCSNTTDDHEPRSENAHNGRALTRQARTWMTSASGRLTVGRCSALPLRSLWYSSPSAGSSAPVASS